MSVEVSDRLLPSWRPSLCLSHCCSFTSWHAGYLKCSLRVDLWDGCHGWCRLMIVAKVTLPMWLLLGMCGHHGVVAMRLSISILAKLVFVHCWCVKPWQDLFHWFVTSSLAVIVSQGLKCDVTGSLLKLTLWEFKRRFSPWSHGGS